MTLELSEAPFGITYRELWLPPGIKGWTGPLPPSVEGGHELTFTGARRGTTCDGVHFTTANDSNINCGAIHNNIPKIWVSFRFKLDEAAFTGMAANIRLFGKRITDDNMLQIQINAGNGRMFWTQRAAAALVFQLESTTNSWEAGRWYHVIVSISDTGPAQRLLVDNVLEDSDTVAAVNIPNGGDVVFGDYDDPGAGTGFPGIISDFYIGTDDLSTAEETDLYNGIPPADAVNAYLLDEGRGITAYDRGSGGNNGTLDTTATWAWGRVQQPVISLDGINDHAASSAGVDISGALTMVWVGKMKSTYNALAADQYFYQVRIDANNEIRLYYFQASDEVRFRCEGGGVSSFTSYVDKPTIDDYLIIIGTLTLGGAINSFINGSLIDSATGAGVIGGAAATSYIGANATPSNYDISKSLFCALIDGAFTNEQIVAYSRFVNSFLNLGLTI